VGRRIHATAKDVEKKPKLGKDRKKNPKDSNNST
jgi:hypothetical protein